MTAYAQATRVDWPDRLASLLAFVNSLCAASWIAMLLANYECQFCLHPGYQGVPFICLRMTDCIGGQGDGLCICWPLTPCLVSHFGGAPVAW